MKSNGNGRPQTKLQLPTRNCGKKDVNLLKIYAIIQISIEAADDYLEMLSNVECNSEKRKCEGEEHFREEETMLIVA